MKTHFLRLKDSKIPTIWQDHGEAESILANWRRCFGREFEIVDARGNPKAIAAS